MSPRSAERTRGTAPDSRDARTPGRDRASGTRNRTYNRKLTNRDSLECEFPMSGGSGDMFLMVKGAQHGLIKGEAQDDQHKGEIEVLSWSWGMQGRIWGGAALGKATIHDLKIVKKVDSASTGLMQALRTNEEIKQAKLTVRKAGKTPLEYLKITIENGRVTSLTVDVADKPGASLGPPDVLERVSFSFNKIQVDYVPQGKDGHPMGGMSFQDEWSDQS